MGWRWRQMRRLARAGRLVPKERRIDVREGEVPIMTWTWDVVPKPQCRRRRFDGPTRKQRAARFVAVPEGSRGGMTLVGSSGARMRRILGFDTPEGRRT